MNQFYHAATTNDSYTANGAMSHSTTGNACLDYFTRCGVYRGRSQEEVDSDMAAIFGADEKVATAIVFFNRAVTRKTQLADDKVSVYGAGQRDEFVKSLRWLEVHRPGILARVIDFVPAVGRWSDLWYDSTVGDYHNYVNPSLVYQLIADVLTRNDTEEMSRLAKYLPTVRSNTKGRNTQRHIRIKQWVDGLLNHLRWTLRQYRKFKSNPARTAHEFQRRMSAGWENMDFGIVPGRALNKMVMSSKDCIGRHGLTAAFEKFVADNDVLPYTGYVYELAKPLLPYARQLNATKIAVINSQFQSLLNMADESVRNHKILPVLDTSGSMSSAVVPDVSALQIAKSVAIYLSMFTKGAFADTVCMFDNTSELKKLSGKFTDRYYQIPNDAMGSTNFQSVIDMLVRVRQSNPEIPLEEYPNTLLVISDMQFNNCGGRTNHQTAIKKLKVVGLDNMSFIWWYVSTYGTNDKVVKHNENGCTIISGFDPNVINVILDKEGTHTVRTPYESMMQALSQPLMQLIQKAV